MPWHGNNAKHVDPDKFQVTLKVLKAEDMKLDGSSNHVYVGNCDDFTPSFRELLAQDHAFMFARTFPQFLAKARLDETVPSGCIALNVVQRLNFEVTDGDEFLWQVHETEERPLSDVTIEVRPRYELDTPITIDAKCLVTQLQKAFWKNIITKHERFVVTYDGVELYLRVVELCNEELDEDDERLDLPDDFRGSLETSTMIYLQQDLSPAFVSSYELENTVSKEDRPPVSSIVDVYCNDEEWFPVKKKLLRPCIKLTKVILNKDVARPSTKIDVDCCTFDRVLLYLMAEAKGVGKTHRIEAEHVSSMLVAAERLGVIGLEKLCKDLLGEFDKRVRVDGIRWNEVVDRNTNQGDILIVIDGMVFDVTRWLPEHPGGNSIIPEQALNKDSTVFFEVYHTSRTSFLYLEQFYIGDIHPEDVSKIPEAPRGIPSDAFLEVLRNYTSWRVEPEVKVHDSF